MLESVDGSVTIAKVRECPVEKPDPQSAVRIGRDTTRRHRIAEVLLDHETVDAHQHLRWSKHRNPHALVGVFGDPGHETDGTPVWPGDRLESPALVHPQTLVQADPEPAG